MSAGHASASVSRGVDVRFTSRKNTPSLGGAGMSENAAAARESPRSSSEGGDALGEHATAPIVLKSARNDSQRIGGTIDPTNPLAFPSSLS